MLDHHLLHLFHRILGVYGDLPLVHEGVDGGLVQPVLEGAVYLPSGEHAHHAPLLDHRKALVAVAAHELFSLSHRCVGGQGMHSEGHDVPHGHRRADVSIQGLNQLIPHSLQRAASDEGCCCAAVASAVELLGQGSHVNGL